MGTYPFKHLNAEKIKNVSVWIIPPDTTTELTEEETEELVHILHNVKIYNRSWKHMFSGGQNCIFTITYNDGRCNRNLLLPLGFHFGLWLRHISSIILYTVHSLGIEIPFGCFNSNA